MNIIPVTVLDNFLPDPDKIREWALKLNYSTDPQGNWPGLRSDELSSINRPFYDWFCKEESLANKAMNLMPKVIKFAKAKNVRDIFNLLN